MIVWDRAKVTGKVVVKINVGRPHPQRQMENGEREELIKKLREIKALDKDDNIKNTETRK